MNQHWHLTSRLLQESKKAELLLVLGHVTSAGQLMDKETLLMVLTLALFIGGIAMGFMAGMNY
jgi:hypothetical protein